MEKHTIISRTLTTRLAALYACIRRFPAAVVFVTAFTAHLLYRIAGDVEIGNALHFALAYYFSVGSLLSLTLHLWREEVTSRSWIVGVHTVLHTLLAADALYLYTLRLEGTPTIETGIGHGACLFALALSVFFLSFRREKNDIASWNFSLQTVSGAAVAVFIGLVMTAGISLLLLSFEHLFGVEIPWKWYSYTSCICAVWLSSLLFLGSIPGGAAKHDRQPQVSTFINGVVHYLFLPLAGSYLLVLYVYATKILLNWELPTGWVSWLVTALMAMVIGIEFALYPIRLKEPQKADQWIARWLPALTLPLLVLMSVGIGRRFHDYGITINRLYLATLNGWFYLVCIGLTASRARRIGWIPVSFAALLLLTSVLPVNYSSLTRKSMYHRLEDAIRQTYHEPLPMDEETCRKWLLSLPKEDNERILDQLSYMQRWFGTESIAPLTAGQFVYYNGIDYHRIDDEGSDKTLPSNVSYTSSKEYISIPEGCSGFFEVYDALSAPAQIAVDSATYSQGILPVPIDKPEQGIQDTLYFGVKALQTACKQEKAQPMEVRCHSPRHRFILTNFRLDAGAYDDGVLAIHILNYGGYLFQKE